MRLTRYSMYKEIEAALLSKISGEVCGISGLEGFDYLMDRPSCTITEGHYPEVDIHHLPYKDDRFDWFITDQVLEHVVDPKRAIEESYRVLKPGGIAIHTTCFVNYYHPAPIDYWRLSPAALEYCCSQFSEIIQAAGWGNRLAFMFMSLGDRFRAVEIPEKRWHPLHKLASYNEPKYPITTWIIAQK